jgi:hypothetical protein
VSAVLLPSSSFHSPQGFHRVLAHKKTARSISSAVSHASADHIPPASAISPKTEKDFSANELAQLLGKHVATIYRWFESVPGVTLKKNSESVRQGERPYRSLTVPQSVLIRFIDEHDITIPSNQKNS